MNLFGLEIRRRAHSSKAVVSRARPAQGRGRPSWFVPGSHTGRWGAAIALERELQTYDEMRVAFPVLDQAVRTWFRLLGKPEIEAGAATVRDLGDWIERVHVNQVDRGLMAWLRMHVDQMLVYGKAVGEIIPNTRRDDVWGLTNLDTKTIDLRSGTDPNTLRVFQRTKGSPWTVELAPGWFLLSIYDQRGDSPHGTSMFRSLPFVCEAASILENATAQVWQRSGAPSYHINWKPEAEFSDPDGTLAATFLGSIADTWKEIMDARQTGDVEDFFTSGDVKVEVAGGLAQLTGLAEPFRAFAEQMVAATGLPAWMLGLNWSTTERLSTQQADLIIAEVESLRRMLGPRLEELLELRQRISGGSGRFRLRWTKVNLRDAVEQARAQAWEEQAAERRLLNAARRWRCGFWTQLRAAQETDPTLDHVERPMADPPPEILGSANVPLQMPLGQGNQ